MSIVISDASCLILFTNIDRLHVLHELFGEVWITSFVCEEYKLPVPDFISIHDPVETGRHDALKLVLDAGEASSIALAAETPNSKILIDEKKGRRIAESMGLDVTGTVGVLLDAIDKGIMQADPHLPEKLDHAGFRLTAQLKALLEPKT